MSKEQSKKRSHIVKIFCLCVVLTCIFTFASCDLNGNKEHDCIFSGSQLNPDNQNSIVSTIEGSTGHKVYTYYLGKNITLADTLEVPEGTFVGICTGEFTITAANSSNATLPLFCVVDSNKDGVTEDGGVFLFQCGTHAYHSKKAYKYMDQSAVDFYGRSGESLYSRFPSSTTDYTISLRADLHISASYTSLIIPSGKTLNVCTNGYRFTTDLNLEQGGGRLAVFNCQSSSYHECLHLNDDAPCVDQSMMPTLSQQVQNAAPGTEIHAYLGSDIEWSGDLTVPEGVTVLVCLNSHSATGSVNEGTYTVTEKDPETGEDVTVEKKCGDLIFFDCSYHLCTGICTTGEMLALNKNSIDWTVRLLEKYVADPESPATIYCVLEDDVAIPAIEGVNLVVCVNGFKTRENVWLTKTVDGEEVVSGTVIYYNCASAHICEIASMVGIENKAILLDTVDGVNLFLSQLGQIPSGETMAINQACFSLTADIKDAGEIRVPEGTFAVICLNGFSMDNVTIAEGSNIVIYECGKEYCSEMKNDVIALDQGIIDLLGVYAKMSGRPYPLNANYIFALSEDVVVPEGALSVGAGFTVDFCTRGHTITGVENISGVVTHKGCTHRIPPHLCAVSDLINRESTPLKAKSAATVSSALAGLGKGVYFYHLTENLVGTGEITAPENAVVGICLDGFSKGDVTVAKGSNVFFFECGKHYCSQKQTNIPTIDQAAFDFFSFCMLGESLTLPYTSTIALSEDITILAGIEVAEGEVLEICTCGHTLTLGSSSGNIQLHDDKKLDVANHFCAVPYLIDPELRSTALHVSNVDSLNAVFEQDKENYIGFYHLTSDILGGGTLILPENFKAFICLNGFSADNVKIPEGASVFFYECGTQYCNVAKDYIVSFDQGVFDLIAALTAPDPEDPEASTDTSFYVGVDQIFALNGDVCIPFDIKIAEGCTLHVCTCGYNFTKAEGVTFTGNVVVHDNCLSEENSTNAPEAGAESTTGCSVCDRMGAQPLNYTTLRDIIDHKGNVILAPASYYFYLENDFQLPRSLIIPSGVDLHICLHGHTLYSAYLWSDTTTYGGGFPEVTCTSVAMVYPGATFNIYDCSEKMTGNVALKQFRMRDPKTGRMEMISYVVEDGTESSGEGLAAVLSSLGSCIALNSGTVNIYGGNMYAITGFINTSGGVLNIYNGNVYAMFAGVVSIDITNMSEARDSKIYIGEGATISSIYMGVYAMGGDVTLDGGTINSGIAGITATSEQEDVPATVTINGGEINVGSSDRLMASSVSAWSAMGGEVIDFAGASLDIGSKEFVGVATTHSLTLNGDVNMVMGEMTEEKTDANGNTESKTVVEFALIGNPTVSVSGRVDGKYTLAIEEKTNIGDNDAFIPLQNAIKQESTEGGIVIIPISGDFISYANVTDMSVSTEGDIKVNIYTEINETFAETGRVRFYVAYADKTEVYTLEDAEIVYINGVKKYKFSIHTSAKDYANAVHCYFDFAPFVPTAEQTTDPFDAYVGVCVGSQKLSIESYLNTVISSRAYGEDTILLAKAMKNYCAAAAYHFEMADNYGVVEGIAPYLDAVTLDALDTFKASKGEAFDVAPLVFKTATVVLKSETSIRIYFDLLEGYTLTTDQNGDVWLTGLYNGNTVTVPITVTVMNTTDKVAFTVTETGNESRPYCLEISGVFAKDYFTMYSVKIADAVYVNYSVASYARTVISNKNNVYSEDVVDVAKAMMVYGYTATVYFDNSEPPSDNGGAE